VSRRFLPAVLFVCLLPAGCGSTSEPTPAEPDSPPIIGCAGIAEGACHAIAEHVSSALPAGRGQPVSIQVLVSDCDGPACAPGVVSGQATAEWVDGGAPVQVRFTGAPADAELDLVDDARWSGVVQPTSKRIAPGAVVPFTLGHCGLLHIVDFDGSFWVPIGELDFDLPENINAAAGQMQLVAPNRAQFASGGKLVATLARFPGPKHFWLCD
jgi:hypothetical protein